MNRAFSLIEMMVALAVTAIVVLSINRVFSVTAETVSKGAAVSDVFASARIIGDQLARDAREMTGPSEGGFIVIVGQTKSGVDIQEDATGTPLETRTIRTDQLLFIRKRTSLEPMVPQSTNSFDSKSAASYCRVWYGHVVRTAPDGTPAGSPGLGDENNRLGADFVLGRQALFLQAIAGDGQQALPATATDDPTGRGLADAQADVVSMGLTVEGRDGAIVGWGAAGSNPDQLLLSLTGSAYLTRALKYTFKGEAFLCNPNPPYPYETTEVAKMHPYLAGRVSQFVVDFAGDYDGTSGLDTTGTGSNRRIRWYGVGNRPSGIGTSPATPLPVRGGDDYVFRHGKVNTNWPHAIRVRYRVHDANGTVIGRDGNSGRWFEQILPIERD